MAASSYKHIAGAATTVVLDYPAILDVVVINSAAAGAITLYDDKDSADAAKIIAIIEPSAGVGTIAYGVYLKEGLTVKTDGASDLTVGYSA